MARLHYGWWIVSAALLTLMVTNGMIIGGINVFDEVLLNEFGWSRSALKFRDLLTFAIAGLLGPFAGALVDRFGVRKLMFFGAALLTVCFLGYSRITSATQMYLIHTLFAAVLASCGLIVTVMLVSYWFAAKRGTAIGLTLIGTSLGGVFFPKLGTELIERLGWRQALAVEAIFPFALIFLIAWVVRNHPRDMGVSAYGQQETPATSSSGSSADYSYKEALRTVTFWALSFAAMATFYSILSAQAHLFLHCRSLGFSPGDASSALALLYLLALVGKFAWGLAADHFDQKKVLLTNITVMWTGSLCLASLKVELLWIAVILFGIGWGGLYTLLQLLTMNSFGLEAGGKILGTVTVVDAIGGGIGIWLTALLYDQSGSYQLPFTVLSILIFLALLASTLINPHLSRSTR